MPDRAVERNDDRRYAASLVDASSYFDEESAVLTEEQIKAVEEFLFNDLATRRSRWAAMLSLTQPGQELTGTIVNADYGTAATYLRLAEQAKMLAQHFRELSDLLGTASTRMTIALCQRQDIADLSGDATRK